MSGDEDGTKNSSMAANTGCAGGEETSLFFVPNANDSGNLISFNFYQAY